MCLQMEISWVNIQSIFLFSVPKEAPNDESNLLWHSTHELFGLISSPLDYERWIM